MNPRATLESIHARKLSERRHLRHLLVNVTTAQAELYRGARVCLRRQANVNHVMPHHAGYFVVITDVLWASRKWRMLLYPTRTSGRKERDQFYAAVNETITYLLALEEREPTCCAQCGAILRLDHLTARFCNAVCVQNWENARRPKKRGA